MERPSSSLIAGVLATALAAGCKDETPTPIVPAACMQKWQDEGYQTGIEDGRKITPVPDSQIAPELTSAQNDANALVGFAASFVASQGEDAVSPEEIQTEIDSQELIGLAFEGDLPSDVDSTSIQEGHLWALSTDVQLLSGQMNGEFDLSGGAGEQGDWSWADVYGTEPHVFQVMFLEASCGSAVPSIEGAIATSYEVDPMGNEGAGSVEQVAQ